jgi:trehalose 6-phosphate phosphatase
MTDRHRIVTAVADWLDEGGRLLLIADFDGTLSALAADPSRASLGPKVRDHLRSLADDRRIRLAIVSGRDLADLRARVGVPDAIYAGCHGLEIDGPDLAFSHPDAEARRESLRTIGLALRQRAPGLAGIRLEPKRLGLAVHYRGLPPDQVPQLELALARAIERKGDGFMVLHGTQAFEVLPRVGWNKGECARYICERVAAASSRPQMTVYMGDDWTDEQAFDALSGHALTVRVGTDAAVSKSQYRVHDVTAVEWVLGALATTAARPARA